MLSASSVCRTPIGPLQADAPTREVQVPADGVSASGMIEFGGGEYHMQGLFITDHNMWLAKSWAASTHVPAWRNAQGAWTTGSWNEWQAAQASIPPWTEYRTVRLPTLPQPVPQHLALALPKKIHYIWVGNQPLSAVRVQRMVRNCQLSTDYVSTLHIDIKAPQTVTQVREQFATLAPNLQIVPMDGTLFFNEFKASENFHFYTQVMSGPGQNFSAASDFLRYPLVNHYAGIYLDTDDALTTNLNAVELLAAPNDVLLGPAVQMDMLKFRGYNSSVFASHANNPVLTEIASEIQRRCRQSDGFFAKVKPRADKNETLLNPAQASMDMRSYGEEQFRLIGPGVMNEVIALERPDYYRLYFLTTPDHSVQSTLHLQDDAYERQLHALVDHYFPFATRAPVIIGGELSWLD
jgi:hypothetical protein